MPGFDSLETARKVQALINDQAKQAAKQVAPLPLIGRVITLDIVNLAATVWIAGDPAPITVEILPNAIPAEWEDHSRPYTGIGTSTIGYGSMVVLRNYQGTPYVTDVLTGGQMVRQLEVLDGYRLVMHRSDGATQDYSNLNPVGVPAWFSTAVEIETFSLDSGKSIVFGPFCNSSGYIKPGKIKMTVQSTNYQDRESTKVYDFMLHPEHLWSNVVASPNRWFRLLPNSEMTAGGYYTAGDGTDNDSDFDIDVTVRSTSLGMPQVDDGTKPLELWFRWVKRFPLGDPNDFDNVQVVFETNVFQNGVSQDGSRQIVQYIDVASPDVVGYVGFHDAYHVERATGGPDFATAQAFKGSQWHNGPWRSASLRAASDLQRTWGHDGLFSWDGSNLKWTGNILLYGIGLHRNILLDGSAFVTCPTSGNIPVMGVTTETFVTATANGIPISSFRALYLAIPPGVASGDLKAHLFLVEDWTKDYSLPEWCIFIAGRPNGSPIPEIRLGNGEYVDKWRGPTLLNSWVEFGGSHATVRYRMGPDQMVIVKGLVKNGVANTIFTLPAGFRPSEIQIFPVMANNGADITVRLDVNPNGNVDRTGVAANTFLSLNTIRFIAEQ